MQIWKNFGSVSAEDANYQKNLLSGDASNYLIWKLKHRLTKEMFEKIQFLTITLSRRFDYVY